MSFLDAPRNGMRRASSGGTKGRKSMASLAQEFHGDDGGDNNGDAGSGMHSLAHELAVALMPEPSAGSKLLQEEFGIEYDEGAEGIDAQPELPSELGDTLADEINGYDHTSPDVQGVPDTAFDVESSLNGLNAQFGSPLPPAKPRKQQAHQDPMDILAKDLESTDKFLSQLRHIDADSSHSLSQPSIEKFASEIIRHINDSVRDRESQVRELLEYEREFRKIAGNVNGNDILGRLDALQEVEGLLDKPGATDSSRQTSGPLETIKEDNHAHLRSSSNDWEMNPDDNFLGDDGEDAFGETLDTPTPMNDSFIIPPPVTGPPTVSKMLPELAHIRSLTTTLVTSLTTISEHAQVNGAANTDAGRKIRALKNKLGGWRSDWDSAEQSRIKIERWEAGLTDDDQPALDSSSIVNGRKRLDARRITEEHLRAFELALADAGTKTQAIMARS